MIQNIEPHVYYNEYRPQRPDADSYLMWCKNGKLIAKKRGAEIDFLTYGEMAELCQDILGKITYLFSVDERKFYLIEENALAEKSILSEEKGLVWIGREEFRTIKPPHLAFAGITAYQLSRWYQSHQFCGRCGAPMKKDEKERMVFCENCHQMEYPKICPAVIVAVTDGNRLLLTKYAGRDYKKYALIAGFAEIGESIEDTVRREVMEEVGLKVKNLTYYKSQPWSFTDTLLFGFFAEVDGSTEIVMDAEELASAEWFEREEIPVNDISVSLTNEMILYFKYGKIEGIADGKE